MNKQFYDSIQKAEAIVIGAGAGLSEAAGLHYSGEDFTSRFQYMKDRYQVEDMFSASFAPFPTLEEYWGFYSLFLYHNRYETGPLPLYRRLLSLLAGKNYFVLTSNVDAQFLLSGF
ncbi:MAG: Sir2 silent information regulator family NAD-dependent deacetylase, partial [Bacilli bacterium]